MSAQTPPIGTRVSRLAAADPDAPAVTCSGVTLTRRELDLSTNRLARAFAARGVGIGDYVTIVLPNSIQWVQSVLAAWKLGATPQPLSARLPDAELEGLLDLHEALGTALLDSDGPATHNEPRGLHEGKALSGSYRDRRVGLSADGRCIPA